MESKFTKDVAFSFLNQDENLALELFSLLKDTLKCFIYTEEQKKLAGTNGENTFNQVFSTEARVVVILYRDNWGKSNWTRIEETAIRNRGHDEGYDFALLIPLDENPNPPKWFPKNRLWIGLERWGIECAASVIEARVQEQGGESRILSLADKIAKIESNNAKRIKMLEFLHSGESVQAERIELEKLVSLFKIEVQKIKEEAPAFHLHIEENKLNGLDLFSNDNFPFITMLIIILLI